MEAAASAAVDTGIVHSPAKKAVKRKRATRDARVSKRTRKTRKRKAKAVPQRVKEIARKSTEHQEALARREAESAHADSAVTPNRKQNPKQSTPKRKQKSKSTPEGEQNPKQRTSKRKQTSKQKKKTGANNKK